MSTRVMRLKVFPVVLELQLVKHSKVNSEQQAEAHRML